jgi:hypothetical protein
MPQASILRNVMTLVSITALPLALYTALAEARGVGITHQSQAQETTSAVRAAKPRSSEDEIVAERAPIQVQASDAASLLDELRLQLAAQPNAKLSIRWQLTRPTESK